MLYELNRLSSWFPAKQNVGGHQSNEDIEQERPEKEDGRIEEEEDDDDDLARNLSSAESDDSEDEAQAKVERGRVKGKLVWDDSLAY